MLQGTIEPNQVDSIIEEGRALIQGGDAKQAVSCFVRAAEADPTNPKVWNDLGVALFITDQIQPAIEAFQTAIRYDAKFPDAYINLATAASKTGNTTLSRETMLQAITELPDHPEIQAVVKDLSPTPAPPAVPDTPVHSAPVEEPPQPTAPVQEAAPVQGDPVEEHVLRGRELVAQGQFQEASQAFLKALELEPACAPAWNDLGVTMHASGEIGAAYEAFQTCLNHDPTFSDAVMNLVSAGKKSGRTEEAIVALRRLLAIVPSNDEARAALTELEASSGATDSATANDDAAQQTAALQLMHDGRDLLGQEAYADAGKKFLEATEVAPGFAPPWNDLGVALYLESHNDLAFQAFETALQLAPGFVDAAINLCKCAERVGRTEDAKKWVDAAIALHPQDTDLAQAAQLLTGASAVTAPAAEPVSTQIPMGDATELAPLDTNAMTDGAYQDHADAIEGIVLAGRQHLMNGNYVEACNTFMDAISKDLTCAIAWNDLGVAMHQSGNTEACVEAFETAMMHEPTLADAPINLAFALLELGQKEAAVNVLQTAMIRCPDSDGIKAAYSRITAQGQQSNGDWMQSVAGQSFVAIDINIDRANATVSSARQNGAATATVHAPTAVRDGLIAPQNIAQTNVVFCGEVLERVPNPAQTLNNLRRIATDTVVVTTRCHPQHINSPAGSIEFTGNTACFIPAAGHEAKHILESFEQGEGRAVEYINGTAVEGGWLLGANDEPRAVWWAWTESFVHQMIETAGFSVVQTRDTQDQGVKAFVCRVA